jgi:hypothetical protein
VIGISLFPVPLCRDWTEVEVEDEEAADADVDGNEIATFTHADKSENSYMMRHWLCVSGCLHAEGRCVSEDD